MMTQLATVRGARAVLEEIRVVLESIRVVLESIGERFEERVRVL
jgi:hypothetical protein